jgi:hypothetical protein
MRAKAKIITLINARSRCPTTVDVSMLSSSFSGLFRIQHRGFAGFHHVLRSADGVRRIGSDDLAGRRPVTRPNSLQPCRIVHKLVIFAVLPA